MCHLVFNLPARDYMGYFKIFYDLLGYNQDL